MRTYTHHAPLGRTLLGLTMLAACTSGAASDAPGDASRSSAGAIGDTSPTTSTAPHEPRLTVPAGMTATVFATVPGARFMVLGPDGAVYVSQPGAGQITRLADADNDGVAESRTVAVRGLNRPHGMAFHGGYFYVANTDGVVRVRLDATGKATTAPERLNHYGAGGAHWTRTIIFAPDGKMYVSIGSTCNVCVERDSTRATVMQFDADGTHGHVYARGLRNAVGLAVYPLTGALWAVQNERDELRPSHENLPPEELNILRDGGDYGWPYCYGNKIPAPEYGSQARCANTIPPALEMQAHSAPLGMTFLTNATQLPEQYRNDMLTAFHGSWNRDTPTGAKVVRVHIENGRPVRTEDFVTGWQRPDGSRWGRPVDVLVYKDGSILISDDQTGRITRISKR